MAFDYAKKIAALIANAEDETLPETTRASYRAKAEQLMRDYRIAEEEAIATESTAAVPVMDEVVIMESRAYSNPMRNHYWAMWSRIADHCGIRTAGKYSAFSYGDDSRLSATAVGYEGDIRYAELLFTAARMVFMTRIDARVNSALSDQQNCYFMRNSGMTRVDIARMLWGSEKTDGAAHGKVQKLYMAECAARGETPRITGRGIQVDIYRQAYADAFVTEIGWRLRAASSAVDKESGGLVLHGRKERVDEAFYAEFPHHRPQTAEEREAAERRYAEERANCEACKKTKHASGECKDHRATQLRQAELRRYQRRTQSAEAKAGYRAGEQAAQEVHIGRAGTSAPRKAEAAATQRQLS